MSQARHLELHSLQNDLPLAAAVGLAGPSAESLLRPFNDLWDAPPQDYAADWSRLLTVQHATSQRDQQLLRPRFYDYLLQRTAEDPANNLEKAYHLVRHLDDPISPRPAEAHFLVMLHRDLPANRPRLLADAAQGKPRVTFQKLSRRVIHLDSKYSIKLQPHSYDFLTKTKLNRYAIHLALSNLND